MKRDLPFFVTFTDSPWRFSKLQTGYCPIVNFYGTLWDKFRLIEKKEQKIGKDDLYHTESEFRSVRHCHVLRKKGIVRVIDLAFSVFVYTISRLNIARDRRITLE